MIEILITEGLKHSLCIPKRIFLSVLIVFKFLAAFIFPFNHKYSIGALPVANAFIIASTAFRQSSTQVFNFCNLLNMCSDESFASAI